MRGWGDSGFGNASENTYTCSNPKGIQERDVKLPLYWVRLGGVISDVARICGRNAHSESLPGCLRY